MSIKIPLPACRVLLILLMFIMTTSTTTTCGENTMQTLYSLNRASMPKLDPTIYSLGKIELLGLMDIPMDNVVATNMLPDTNAVTLIEFKGKHVKYKTLAKNFKGYVAGGDMVFLPAFSEHTIGYSQTRGFNLLNIHTKKNRYYSIIGQMSCRIDQIAVLDSEKQLFLFSIDFSGAEKPTKLLRLMDLSTEEGKVVAEKYVNGNYDWVYADKMILFIDMKNNGNAMAMNLNLEECDHPLVTYINTNKVRFNRLVGINIHPVLPFAVIPIEGGKITKIVTWNNENGKMNEYKIFDSLDCVQMDYTFSQDGKWVYFTEVILGMNKSNYILMPVDPTLPHYLGQPVYLGEVPDFPRNVTAMTRNPAGLVVSGCETYGKSYWLKKWDFTQALPLIEKAK